MPTKHQKRAWLKILCALTRPFGLIIYYLTIALVKKISWIRPWMYVYTTNKKEWGLRDVYLSVSQSRVLKQTTYILPVAY